MTRRVLTGGAAIAAGWSLPALAPIAPPVSRALRIPRTLERDDAVAITFDDGPHAEGTPAVLEALRAAGMRATFFLVGEQIERTGSLAAEIAAAGHGIAIHGYRHRNQLRLTAGELDDDYARAEEVIAEATGTSPAIYRPAYGIFSWPGLSGVRRRGWTPLLWSRWGRDWAASATPESIAAKVTDGLTGGDVLLLHDADTYSAPGSHRRTAAALPRVLEEIQRRRLEPVTL
jgi:peptidoglycan-N-acetylglucosamine deacetylase